MLEGGGRGARGEVEGVLEGGGRGARGGGGGGRCAREGWKSLSTPPLVGRINS